MKKKIFIIDDEKDICDLLSDILQDNGFVTASFFESSSAFENLKKELPDLIILDIWLKNSPLDGIGILEILQKRCPFIPVIIISGHATEAIANKAITIGAYEYISKPFKEGQFVNSVKKALDFAECRAKRDYLAKRLKNTIGFLDIKSAQIEGFKKDVDKIAESDSRVFITGPKGSELRDIAYHIHMQSKRIKSKFVSLHTMTLTEGQFNPYLFGRENSGEFNISLGALDRANDGTLFIDEICNLPKDTQKQLVSFLQDNSFKRVGSNEKTFANVRIISCTYKDVEKEIKLGNVLEELYYRLKIKVLKIPRMNKMIEDFEYLLTQISTFLAKINRTKPLRFSKESIDLIKAYQWRNDIKELKHFINWLYIKYGTDDKLITPEMLPRDFLQLNDYQSDNKSGIDCINMNLKDAREMFEKQYLQAQLNKFKGNVSKTAEFIEMERTALHRKIKGLGISTKQVS